ncbi:Protein of unknown function [Micromonospora tulbaghiae]|uniref:DUF4240 domain-containing protein n=2 Tax=Micromonospora tulbaghiae TaxID=479978 RepID=A0ABY0KEX1_9ACTN|nr:Protein of unknown function [Micromonospora tulbaghiae]
MIRVTFCTKRYEAGPVTVLDVDMAEFWTLLERSAGETTGPDHRLDWLTHQLSQVSLEHVVDFQINLEAARRPIDTYAMWGAANQILDGLCSSDAFWYFQPWLIGQGQRLWHHVAQNPDNLADLVAVRVLAGRSHEEWADAEWPQWEELAYAAADAYERATGRRDGLYEALDARGHRAYADPEPNDQPWNSDSLTEIAQRLPRLARLFPRRHYVTP